MLAVKKHSNQIVKILICLCLTFVFIFVQPRENTQEAEAILPLLPIVGGFLLSFVAEEALEMGIKHYTADGKTSKKTKSQKIADEIFENYLDYDFDFMNKNPVRKADGSLVITPSANDRAKIAKKIADEFGDVLAGDNVPMLSNTAVYTDDGTAMIVDFRAGSTLAADVLAKDFLRYMFNVNVDRVAPGDNRLHMWLESKVSGTETYVGYFNSSGSGQSPVNNVFYSYPNGSPNFLYNLVPDTKLNSIKIEAYGGSTYYPNISDYPTQQVFLATQAVKGLVAMGGGLLVPRTLEKVYPAPYNMTDDTVLPNAYDLSNKPIVLKDVYPVSSSDDDMTWSEVNNDYEIDNSKYTQNVETYLENGDINKNVYNTQTVNNYYTDSNYPVKSGDVVVNVKVDVDVPPPVVIDDDSDISADGFKYCVDKSTNKVVPCKDIEAIDGGLLAYVRDSYNYAVNAVQTAVNGLETIANGSVGLIALYSEIFDWLPDEVTVLLTSGLMLMIGLRVFRK